MNEINIHDLFQQGFALHGQGYLLQAKSIYEQVLVRQNNYFDALHMLGVLYYQLKSNMKAEELLSQAMQVNPNNPEVYSNFGNVLKALMRPEEALANYDKALELKCDFVDALCNRGNTLRYLNRLGDALVSYDKAIALKPDHAEAYFNRGDTLGDLNRLEEALVSFNKAIEYKFNYVEALNNRGNKLKDLFRFKLAEKSYREAIQFDPDFFQAYTNLGMVLTDLGEFKEAEKNYREAIRLKPEHAILYSNLLFGLNYSVNQTTESALLEATQCGAIISAKAIPKLVTNSIKTDSSKLRVGFVSGDLREHPVGYFVEGLIKHFDSSKFEIYAFSTIKKEDDLTNRIKPYFKGWTSIHAMTDYEAALAIHKQHIQVLIDLSGHTAHSRLAVFSHRPVAVQVSWLGYFATTGLPEMDYFIGDRIMSPKSESHHFSEKIWNLPQSWLCLEPPNQLIPICEPPVSINGFVTFGCFGNLSKMNKEVVETWTTILHSVPNSKIFLKARQLADLEVVVGIQKLFSKYEISVDRLILEGPSSRSVYLESYNKVDIVLDTFPYPGGTTSVDALWMGVPVLTLKGERFLSHLGESIAMCIERNNWIAENKNNYVNKAIAFAFDASHFTFARKELREHVLQTPLFDTEQFAKNFGDAVLGMWRESSGNI